MIVAGAGAGKTTYLVNNALKCADKGERILIATYTIANRDEIKRKFIEKRGFIPYGIDNITWFSFLLRDGVRPFRHEAIPERIERILFDEGSPQNRGIKKLTHRYYCPADGVVHSGLLSEIAYECNNQTNGAVTDRIARKYDLILLDEVQDFAGYDFSFIDEIARTGVHIELVGDPRQKTYSTTHSAKNKHYETFFDYAKGKMPYADIDESTLGISYRCNRSILNIANNLCNQYPPLQSGATNLSEHNGIYLVEESESDTYIKQYQPTVLRYSKKTKTPNYAVAMNMASTKGMTFDRVFIFPTKDMRSWFAKPDSVQLQSQTQAKLYVALTRAKYSVAISVPNGFHKKCSLIPRWLPEKQ